MVFKRECVMKAFTGFELNYLSKLLYLDPQGLYSEFERLSFVIGWRICGKIVDHEFISNLVYNLVFALGFALVLPMVLNTSSN